MNKVSVARWSELPDREPRHALVEGVDLVVVRSINEIARLGDVATIAEYVESQDILSRLGELGVDYAQGFAVGRPMPIAEKAA